MKRAHKARYKLKVSWYLWLKDFEHKMEKLKGYGSLDDGAAIEPSPVAMPAVAADSCLSFHNISYVVEKKLCRKHRKIILNDVR